jgi:hypothetical protein
MPGSGWSIYTAAEPDVTTDLLEAFLSEQRRDRQFMESMTLELKRERRGHGVPDAVCALANSAGGVVIVGIDEREPTLERAPGLTPHSVVSLSDQLRGSLGPLVRPELIPVPVGTDGRVAVVIRVEVDASLWPVVSNGRVMVRNPGSSVAATREQILDLVHRRGSAAYAGETALALSTYAPNTIPPGENESRGDLLFRMATAVYVRPRVGMPFRIGSDERRNLCDVFVASPFGRVFDRPRPAHSTQPRPQHDLVEESFSSTHFIVTVTVPDDEHVDRLTLSIARNGNQVRVLIDAEVRMPRQDVDASERDDPSAARSELSYLAICGLETLSQHLVPKLVELIGGAPLRIDDIYLWAQSPRNQDISRALSLTGARRTVPSTRSNWGAIVRHATDADDAVEVLRPELETFYIDIGLTEEQDLANRDLADGRRSREYQA